MNGGSGSWRDFSAIGGGARRSSAWTTLLSVPAGGCSGAANYPHGASSSLFPSVSTESFLDNSKLPGQHGNNSSGANSLPGSSLFLDSLVGGKIGGPENHKRAASEFVLELAGPVERVNSMGMHGRRGTLLCSEELPVPMFSINKDLRCTMWNCRLTDLTGWNEDDVMGMSNFTGRVLCLEDSRGSCDSLLKTSMSGDDISGIPIRLQSKSGAEIPALLYGCQQSVGGFTCVVMQQNRPRSWAQESDTDACRGSLATGYDQCYGSQSDVSTEPNTPMTPALDGGTWFKSSKRNREGSFDSTSSTSHIGFDQSSRSTSANGARALLISSASPSASILSSQLERCGVEVVDATSPREAVWRLQKSLEEGGEAQHVSLVFLELQAASNDGYAAMKEIRKLEKAYLGERQKTMVVGVTNTNRWDLAGMDIFMDRGIDAGVDAIIPQHIQMQQLRATLRKLGVQSKYLQVPAPLIRALSGNIHNPLNLTR